MYSPSVEGSRMLLMLICHCLLVLCCSCLVCCFDQESRDVGHYRKLFSCGWVHLPLSIPHDLQLLEEAFRPHYFGGISVTGQCNFLANGCKRATDCAIFDLVSLTIVACAHSCCKSGEHSDPC
jgi:hypothetical protein